MRIFICIINVLRKMVHFRLNEHKFNILNRETKKSAIAKHCRENDHTFNFTLPKLFASPPLYSNLISLKHTISIKIIIMSLTAISLFLLCQTVENLSLDIISPDSSNFFADFTSISLF